MMKLLTSSTTLWVLFGMFVVETICFGVVMAVWDFGIIDEMSDPEKIRHHIEDMSHKQRIVHAWMTGTLDVVYPLTYGSLFAGLALRVFRPVFAIPAFAVIPIDLAEGLVQILILLGGDYLLWLKAYITPLKLVFFTLTILIAISAVVTELKNRRKRTT